MPPTLLKKEHVSTGAEAVPGPSARHHMERSGGLCDLLAVPARKLLADRLDHLPQARDHLERLGDVLAKPGKPILAAGREGRGCGNRDTLARQMIGERLPCGPLALEPGNRAVLAAASSAIRSFSAASASSSSSCSSICSSRCRLRSAFLGRIHPASTPVKTSKRRTPLLPASSHDIVIAPAPPSTIRARTLGAPHHPRKVGSGHRSDVRCQRSGRTASSARRRTAPMHPRTGGGGA